MAADDSSSVENTKIRTNRTLICSVVFLDIVEYSKKPVVEQMSMKEQFNAILTESLRDIPISDRIILDTGDGAAIGFLGDPEDALFVAMSIREALSIEREKTGLFVRLGINLGPVKVLKDINQQMNLIGDGINVAQRIMSFAEPGQLLVSRSYYDIISCLSQEYAQLFQYKGAKADKHVREHDIYAVENTGLRPASSHHHEGKRQPDAAKNEPPDAVEIRAPGAVVAAPEPDAGVKKKSTKNMLLIVVPLVALILVLAVIFFNPRSQDKSSSSAALSKSEARAAKAELAAQKKEAARVEREARKAEEREKAEAARIAEKKAEDNKGAYEETAIFPSVKADDIEFISAGIRRSGEEVTFSVRMYNRSAMSKSVALYDDYVRWPKSKITDPTGKAFEVNKVVFTKGTQSLTSQATGTQGLMIGSGETALVSLTFRNAGKGVKSFSLHPFIYVGRSWKEHDLPMKFGF